MPQSLAIGSFVLGGVLLLIAVVGGRFKLFGAQVEGSAGPFARLFAGLFGLVLLAAGFGSELAKPTSADPQPPPGGTQFLPRAAGDSPGVGRSPAPAPPPAARASEEEPEGEVRPAAGRESVAAAVSGALDAAMEAMNRRSAAPLERFFEGGAREQVAGLAQGVPPLVRMLGIEMSPSIEGLEFDAVELAADGRHAQARFRFSVAYHTTGYGQCAKLLEGPFSTTYVLRRAGEAWRVYQIQGHNPTQPPVQEVPC